MYVNSLMGMGHRVARLEERSGSTCSPSLEVGGKRLSLNDRNLQNQTYNAKCLAEFVLRFRLTSVRIIDEVPMNSAEAEVSRGIGICT